MGLLREGAVNSGWSRGLDVGVRRGVAGCGIGTPLKWHLWGWASGLEVGSSVWEADFAERERDVFRNRSRRGNAIFFKVSLQNQWVTRGDAVMSSKHTTPKFVTLFDFFFYLSLHREKLVANTFQPENYTV